MFVTQSCLTLCDPMDCSPPGSSVHGILQARTGVREPFPSPEDLSDPGMELKSPALQAFFTFWDTREAHYTGRALSVVYFLCSSGFSPTFDTCSQLPGSKCWQKVKKIAEGFPGGSVVKNLSACQCRRHGFDPWPGKIAHAAKQLSPRAPEPVH